MYLNLDRVEFTMTYHCTGRCAHCSQGEMSGHPPGHLPYALCEGVLTRLAQRFPLRSAMCFGGEPLLWPEDTVALLREAKAAGIPRRQVITNGYFSRDPARVAQVAGWLGEVGAEVLLSADAFHQRRIPLSAALDFARRLAADGRCRLRIHPAWLQGPQGQNEWDEETRRVLAAFVAEGFAVSSGNQIAPAGSAARHLGRYFFRPAALDGSFRCGQAPYTTPLDRGETLSVLPDGTVALCAFSIGDLRCQGIDEIVDGYDPFARPDIAALLRGGVAGYRAYVGEQGVEVGEEGLYTPCDLCRRLTEKRRLQEGAEVRQAGPADRAAALALAGKLWPGSGAEELAEDLAPCFSGPDGAIFLAWQVGRPVGYAQCQLRRDYVEGARPGPVGYLEGIYLEPDCRGQGLSRRLLERCEAWARGRGCRQFASDCDFGNAASQSFHRRAGFREVGRIVCFLKEL